MPRIPRDISGKKLAHILQKYGYQVSRETGSHLRLASNWKGREHKITIPDHQEIKIGTLNNILNDLADYLGQSKTQLIENLFIKH